MEPKMGAFVLNDAVAACATLANNMAAAIAARALTSLQSLCGENDSERDPEGIRTRALVAPIQLLDYYYSNSSL